MRPSRENVGWEVPGQPWEKTCGRGRKRESDAQEGAQQCRGLQKSPVTRLACAYSVKMMRTKGRHFSELNEGRKTGPFKIQEP